jgi:hypothetical protein
MFGNHYHWQRRSWFARMGVDPMLATVVALLGGVALLRHCVGLSSRAEIHKSGSMPASVLHRLFA